MSKHPQSHTVPVEQIAQSIFILRGQKVILDADLAALYGVATKRFNEAVKRNHQRFPDDFAFRLTTAEFTDLRSSVRLGDTQVSESTMEKPSWSRFATSSAHYRGTTYRPWAFTDMVLNSARAVATSVYVVRAFVKLRKIFASNEVLAKRISELEAHFTNRLSKHNRKLGTHEQAIVGIFKTLHELMNSPQPNAIGFTADLRRKI
jgi:hypothetical protein